MLFSESDHHGALLESFDLGQKATHRWPVFCSNMLRLENEAPVGPQSSFGECEAGSAFGAQKPSAHTLENLRQVRVSHRVFFLSEGREWCGGPLNGLLRPQRLKALRDGIR